MYIVHMNKKHRMGIHRWQPLSSPPSRKMIDWIEEKYFCDFCDSACESGSNETQRSRHSKRQHYLPKATQTADRRPAKLSLVIIIKQ